MVRIIALLIGYAFGLIQTAYIIGRIHHTDIRQHGSGNAGTTNALRTFGKKAALITLLVDVLKCVAAVLVVRALFGKTQADILPLLSTYAGFGCILGHNFPVYMKFKGGKGIASSLGFVTALCPLLGCLILVIFIVTFLKTHYVSLGSLLSYLAGCLGIIILLGNGYFGMVSPRRIEMGILVVLLTVLAFYRHRANIKRLHAGTESKVYLKKK